jgi:hypothetical protein
MANTHQTVSDVHSMVSALEISPSKDCESSKIYNNGHHAQNDLPAASGDAHAGGGERVKELKKAKQNGTHER